MGYQENHVPYSIRDIEHIVQGLPTPAEDLPKTRCSYLKTPIVFEIHWTKQLCALGAPDFATKIEGVIALTIKISRNSQCRHHLRSDLLLEWDLIC